jgi:phosphoribosylformylglycinamidine synthase
MAAYHHRRSDFLVSDIASEGPLNATSAAPGWLARIHVSFKAAVLDPQGEAVLHGLHQLGYQSVARVRAGKYFEITLAAPDQGAAEDTVRQMCDRLLANPVIERYDYTVQETAAAQG